MKVPLPFQCGFQGCSVAKASDGRGGFTPRCEEHRGKHRTRNGRKLKVVPVQSHAQFVKKIVKRRKATKAKRKAKRAAAKKRKR